MRKSMRVLPSLLACGALLVANAAACDGVAPSGLVLTQDDVALGAASLGIDLFVDPGEHVYAVSVPREVRSSAQPIAPWLLVGSGAAAAIAGGVFGIVVLSASTQVKN